MDRLLDRGLAIPDRDRALRYVRRLGYYRLSPYMIPFRQPRSDDFRTGTAFDQILNLYVFDRHLRLLVMDALERVEVAARAALTDHMSTKDGDAFWYTNDAHFTDRRTHVRFLGIVDQTCRNQLDASPERPSGELSHRSALEHFLTTYGTPERPPSWVMVETLTLGQLDSLINNLRARSDRTHIALQLGLVEPLLRSWMRSFVRLRNICAHHGRLWNAVLGVAPALPQSRRVQWLSEPSALTDYPYRRERLYPALVALQSVLGTVSPRSRWAEQLSALLNDFTTVPIEAMGFPSDWASDPFWAGRGVQPRG